MINILLIEDDEDDVLLFKEILSEGTLREYQLDVRANYDHALNAIQTNSYDILLVDYNLGKKTGLDLMREARVGSRMIPFILLTGVAVQKRDEEALNLGAYDFLVKGSMTPELVTRSILYAMKHASTLRDLKTSESQKHALLEQQFTVQKLQAIGTLVGGVAHDFNNILGGIQATAQRLNTKTTDDPELSRYSSNIISLTNRGKDVVSQLLTYARQNETKTTVHDVNSITKDAANMVRSMTPAMITITDDIPIDPNFVHCEAGQIHQIVTNLIINASQALGQKVGTITVKVKPVTIEGGYARDIGWLSQRSMFQKIESKLIEGRLASEMKIGLLDAGEYVRITVADDGMGMDADTMSRIMDPFFTTKALTGGTGLGLATVRGIISMLRGGILVTSLPNEFTIFDLFLPTVRETPQQSSAPEPETDVVGKGKRIMLVDDELSLGEMYKEFLEEQGFIVDYFTSPLEALSQFKQAPNGWDALISDDSMPSMRGLVLIEEIRQLNADIPAIIWSGRPLWDTAETLSRLKVNAALIKPVAFGEMTKALAKIFSPVDTPSGSQQSGKT